MRESVHVDLVVAGPPAVGRLRHARGAHGRDSSTAVAPGSEDTRRCLRRRAGAWLGLTEEAGLVLKELNEEYVNGD
jgi:hypothetical protein